MKRNFRVYRPYCEIRVADSGENSLPDSRYSVFTNSVSRLGIESHGLHSFGDREDAGRHVHGIIGEFGIHNVEVVSTKFVKDKLGTRMVEEKGFAA